MKEFYRDYMEPRLQGWNPPLISIITGQFGDIPSEKLFKIMSEIGYTGLELACGACESADDPLQCHFDVQLALKDDGYCAAKRAQLSPAEQQLVDKIEDAVDAESLSALLALAPKAEAAKPAVRVSYVEALGWFGRKALPEMTPFLADTDQEVRDTAVSEWTQALDEIEDDARRLAIAERAFMVVSDEDVLESISGAYLGIDDESLAVASLAKIIAADCPAEAREKAKETYNFVTGDEWTGAAAAEEWISQYKRENEEDQEHNDIYDNQDEESEDQDE